MEAMGRGKGKENGIVLLAGALAYLFLHQVFPKT